MATARPPIDVMSWTTRSAASLLATKLTATGKRRRQIATRDFFEPTRRLQIVFRLRCGAPSFQSIWKSGKAMFQPVFRCFLYGLRVQQAGFGRVDLPDGVQQPVVSVRDLENDLSVCVVEGKVGGSGLRTGSCDAPRARAKVKHNVIQLHRRSKRCDRLTHKIAAEQHVLAVHLREGDGG